MVVITGNEKMFANVKLSKEEISLINKKRNSRGSVAEVQ